MTDIAEAPKIDSPVRTMLREFFLWAGVLAFADLLVTIVKGEHLSFASAEPFVVSAIAVALFGGWRRLKASKTLSDHSA
jgi:hypothetical protein